MSIEYKIKTRGLGSNLCFLSLLLDTKKPVTLHVDKIYSYDLFSQIKEIFRIPDEQLLILPADVQDDEDEMNFVTDSCKMFSPYIDIDCVKIFNHVYSLDREPNKPCIGVSCYNHAFGHFSNNEYKHNPKKFPRNRQYTIQENVKIFELIKKAGYDIISLDSQYMSLENKIFAINRLCDCVIGYEGGMMHLAHILKVPTIILPWRFLSGGSTAQKIHLDLLCQILHLDQRSFFLNSIDELLSWNSKHLRRKIDNLYDMKSGNNIYFKNSTKIKMSNDLKTIFVNASNKSTRVGTNLTDKESNFILDQFDINLDNPRLGGLL